MGGKLANDPNVNERRLTGASERGAVQGGEWRRSSAAVAREQRVLTESGEVGEQCGELGAGLLWVPLGTLALGAVAGLIPALKAYTTDPSRTLGQTP